MLCSITDYKDEFQYELYGDFNGDCCSKSCPFLPKCFYTDFEIFINKVKTVKFRLKNEHSTLDFEYSEVTHRRAGITSENVPGVTSIRMTGSFRL